MFTKKDLKIGWIGTGVMGLSMCQHLLDQDYEVFVYNRTKAKANSLLKNGANWCSSPKEIAQNSNLICTMVGFPKDIENVYFGEDGIFKGLQEHSILVDFTTTKPSLAKDIATEAQKKNATALDAPVSGGDVGAKNASLSIMVGGNQKAYEEILPIFKSLGKNIVYQGLAGAGQNTKMTNQIVIASTMIGVCEALYYAQKAGLDIPTVLQSISGGAAGCWTLDNLAPRIVKDDYAPGFYIDHFLKDLDIAIMQAQTYDIKLPGLALAYKLYHLLQKEGQGKSGTQALIHALKLL